jgi:predicted nuclease of predicted toxin-antitoxin system
MRILADENLDAEIVVYLRGLGNDVVWIVEAGRGMSDVEILELAQQESRVVVTFDRDFGELVFRHGRASAGVVLLRLDMGPPGFVLAQFEAVWGKVAALVTGQFIVATSRKIRVRPLPRRS